MMQSDLTAERDIMAAEGASGTSFSPGDSAAFPACAEDQVGSPSFTLQTSIPLLCLSWHRPGLSWPSSWKLLWKLIGMRGSVGVPAPPCWCSHLVSRLPLQPVQRMTCCDCSVVEHG